MLLQNAPKWEPSSRRQESTVMDEEMSFPNPVERHDLPVKRTYWKRWVAAVLVVGVLAIACLPQILHNRIGRRLLRARLEGQYNAEIAIQDITTSWRGGTTVSQFWIKGGDGRVVGFAEIKSEMSLWKLLRGHYDLGKCTVDGLVVDWVFDSGDDAHRDTYERLTNTGPWRPGTPYAKLAHLSGDITINNAQVNFYRGETNPKTLLTTQQAVRFAAVSGSVKIPKSLDEPWTYALDGNVGLTGEERGQTFETSGTLALGERGFLVPSGIRVDATAKATNLPTEIVGVFCPLLAPNDYKAAFGPTFERADLALNGSNGLLTLDVRELATPRAQVHVRPTFDLKTFPATVGLAAPKSDADNTITASLPAGPAKRGLALVNPLVQQATDGTFVLRVKSLDVPLSRQWWLGTAKAQLDLTDLTLSTRREMLVDNYPRSVLGQIGLVSGDTSATPTLHAEPSNFTVEGGNVTVAPTAMTVGSAKVVLKGTATVEGELKMALAVTSPQLAAEVKGLTKVASTGPASTEPAVAAVLVPLTGTVDKPKLQVDAAAAGLPAGASASFKQWVDGHLEALRARDAEAAQREKEREVQEMLKSFTPEKK